MEEIKNDNYQNQINLLDNEYKENNKIEDFEKIVHFINHYEMKKKELKPENKYYRLFTSYLVEFMGTFFLSLTIQLSTSLNQLEACFSIIFCIISLTFMGNPVFIFFLILFYR
jgi:hypothetical protein